jgi:hypothetical protein
MEHPLAIMADIIASQGRMIAKMGAWLEGTKACWDEAKACLEGKEPNPEKMSNLATHPEDSNGHTVLFPHCARDMVIEDMVRQPATALEDEVGQRSHIWEVRRHSMRP